MSIHVCTCLSNRFYICFPTKSCKMMHHHHQYSMQRQYLVTQTKLHSMGIAARRPARSAGSQWTLSLGDARSKVTSMLPLSARLVAYPRTRSFNVHSGVRRDIPAHSLSNIEKLLLSRPSARLYFWGPQGTNDKQRPINHCRSSPSPKEVLSADKSSLTGRFCQTLNDGP